MAHQIADRFKIPHYFTDPREMLETLKLDVVHITTPPHSHFELAHLCLQAGLCVYVEKPFTLNTAEAEKLIGLANQNAIKITAGHNAQFTHAMVRMRELLKTGYLGGEPVHIESIYCYNFNDESYAKAMLGDARHWVRKLPGSLPQNIISHGVSKIAEFLKTDDPIVIATGSTSNFLKRIGQDDIIDELRVMIQDADGMTAYFTFSSQISPTLHQFRLYGPKNSLVVDDDHQIVIKITNEDHKSYLRYFVPPLTYAKQYVGNLAINMMKFMRNDFHLPFDAGLKTLIESFYASVADNAPLPISYKEILLTSRIMDKIFEQVARKDEVRRTSPVQVHQ
jgi:predicted dehydrogenase